MTRNRIVIAIVLFLDLVAFLAGFSACVAAASDPQGALVFLVALPLIVLLMGVNLIILQVWVDRCPARAPLKVTSWFGLGYTALFLAGFFFKPLQIVPAQTTLLVSTVFERITGQSPYEYSHSHH